MRSTRTLVFIDGENVVFRYQSLVAAGRLPQHQVVHTPDVFVWNPTVFRNELWDLVRVTYYTSLVGDDPAQQAMADEIQQHYHSTRERGCYLHAAVFKKLKQSNKTRSVDINITIDALRHCYGNHADVFCFVTGDVDFLPLIRAVMQEGKEVVLYSFERDLNPALRSAPDRFVPLEKAFFKP